MNTLYIAWQDPENRCWHTVGSLSRQNGSYQFVYTRGALASPRFKYLGRMRDKEQVYQSEDLFPLFANRLLSESRPEYPDYLNWLGVTKGANEMELLARSGGQRGTDQLCVYPEVEADKTGNAELFFFSHGLRYLTEGERAVIEQLKPGDHLQLTQEPNNEKDQFAIMLETKAPVHVGYCPRYLNQDLLEIKDRTQVYLAVEKVNRKAPLQFHLLCKATFRLPPGTKVYATDEHFPLAENVKAA